MSSKAFLLGGNIIHAPGRQNKAIHINRVAAAKPGYVDMLYGGTHSVSGTVAVAGSPDVPVERLVILLDPKIFRPVRQAVSDGGSGAYAFPNVKRGPWIVLSRDHTGEYNAVIADNIIGEAM